MSKFAALVWLVVLSSPVFAVSATFDDYVNVFEDTNLRTCIVPLLGSNGQDLSLSIDVNMDEPETVTTRYCPNGILMNVPYERNLWVLDDDLDSVGGLYREIGFFSLANYVDFIGVFEPTVEGSPSVNLDRVQYVPSWTTNYVNRANAYLKYDISRNNRFGLATAPLYFSLANDDVSGGSFYDTSSSSFVDDSLFLAAGLGVPSEDLSNPSVLVANGGSCGSFKCVKTSQVDLDVVNDAGAAFFAFSPDLNYYYLPYYVKGIEYSVRAYTNGSEVYSRTGSVAATSTDVFFPETYNPYVPRTRIPDNFFNFGSQIKFSGEVASIPSGADTAVVAFKLVLYRNPLYRHRSPADASWYLENVSDSFATLGAGLGASDVKLSWSQSFNLSSFTVDSPVTDYDNSSPLNDFNSSVDDGAGVEVPVTVGNGTGGFGVDWARDPNAGGGLQGQFEYAEGLMTAENKHGFFNGLARVTDAVFRMFLALFLICALLAAVFVLFLMLPSAYRKLGNELKKLGDARWG